MEKLANIALKILVVALIFVSTQQFFLVKENQQKRELVSELIKSGVDPIVASCAVYNSKLASRVICKRVEQQFTTLAK